MHSVLSLLINAWNFDISFFYSDFAILGAPPVSSGQCLQSKKMLAREQEFCCHVGSGTVSHFSC